MLEDSFSSMSIPLSRINIKTKKCQPVGDRPDLIQTAPVPNTGLARQQNKNQPNKKNKNIKTNYQSHVKSEITVKLKKSIPLSLECGSDASLPVANKLSLECRSNVSLPVANKLIKVLVNHPDDKWLTDDLTKTKKCHSEARDRPDLIHTAPVPGGGLARTKIKNTKSKNPKINYLSNVTLVKVVKLTRQFSQSQVSSLIKIKKCHSEARDRPDLIQTAPVPGGSLARPKNKNKLNEKSKKHNSNYLSHVILVKKNKLTRQFSQSQVSSLIKIKKCHSEARDRPDLIQTAPVPGGGLARTKIKNTK